MQASAIFQRTESGRSEIKNKMHGLTQSERLALIVVDGVSTYGDLRKKLNGLSEERMERALTKLLQKNLVFEVLLSTDDAVDEEIDSKTVDRFLHQDPLDPVTIMSIDPEEEFDLDMPREISSTPQFQSVQVTPLISKSAHETSHSTRKENIAADTSAPILNAKKHLKIDSVDFYVPIEKSDQAASNQTGASGAKIISAVPRVSGGPAAEVGKVGLASTKSQGRGTAWSALLLVGGLIIIIGSLLFSFRH